MGYILTDTSPAYELVGDITVSSATTSVSFTGLNFTSADDLLLVSDIYNPTTAGSYFLTFNGNNTNTNYYREYLSAQSTGFAAGRINDSSLMHVDITKRSISYAQIKLTNNNYIVLQSNFIRDYGLSSVFLNKHYNTSTFTATSITQLTVTAEIANAIGIGSRFRLYKLVAEKVADITVSTATTSIDITGLSIDKGSEYMLVSEVKNGLASGNSDVLMYVNNNNTTTNYWNQYMYATGTSIGSGRQNTATYTGSAANYIFLIYSNIKLTNNGNFVSQNSVLERIGTSEVVGTSINLTSTFTVTSITKLSLTSAVTNVIGVGSRFQLYKLR